MRQKVLIVLLILLGASCSSVAPAEEAFFPVMAWDGPPNDAAVLKKMRECGFTVAGFVPVSALDTCYAAGLKAIVMDPRTSGYDWPAVDANKAKEQVTSLVAEVGNHPAVYGYYLRDEPPASFFPGLATVAGFVKELDPEAWPYINLFPNYAHQATLGAENYDAYVEQFVKTCRPTVLTYDHYALIEGDKLRPEYFANLQTMRRFSLQNKVPFWNIVLAACHFNYREVTAADFRFQAYTSLAYGARGLAYFKYFTPAVGNYRAGPIDQFGHETPTWHALRNVNLQIEKLAPTLLQLTSQRVYHFGDVPAGCTGPDEESAIKAINGPMLVGDFTHADGAEYVFIVNKNLKRSYFCKPEFRESVAKLELVSPYTGQLTPFEGEQVWIGPGQGSLLRVTR